jgi:CheY-like chemotaxis protein
MMARVGGLTVIETLRQNNNRVPIIAISYDHLMGNEAIKLGANFFIAKPFQPDELREKVKEVFFGKE